MLLKNIILNVCSRYSRFSCGTSISKNQWLFFILFQNVFLPIAQYIIHIIIIINASPLKRIVYSANTDGSSFQSLEKVDNDIISFSR